MATLDGAMGSVPAHRTDMRLSMLAKVSRWCWSSENRPRGLHYTAMKSHMVSGNRYGVPYYMSDNQLRTTTDNVFALLDLVPLLLLLSMLLLLPLPSVLLLLLLLFQLYC